MSTKSSLKYEREDETGKSFHLYEEVFDEEHVYLDLQGFPFEAASTNMFPEKGQPQLVVQLPRKWAQMLGLVEE